MKFYKPLPSLFLLSLIAVLIVFTLTPSCRKIHEVQERPDDELVQKFFRVPDDANESLRSIIADIKRQEDKHHFVNQLAGKYGLPLWNKSITNPQERKNTGLANGRGSGAEGPQLFLIPFQANDGSISSYLFCAKSGEEFTYRYYKKDRLSILYAANDTIKALREGLLSVFGFFEKKINNKDSLKIAGIYNKQFKKVSISINGEEIKPNARGTVNTSISYLTVCYTTSGPQARLQSLTMPCMTVAVYGSLLDLGFTTSNGYSSDGTSGSGSVGSSTFPDGFVCPQTEWWCESGNFRIIDGILYTPESYLGIDASFPWLWWESPSNTYAFIAPSDLPGLDLTEYLRCFTNDATSTYKITVAVDQPIPGTRTKYTTGNSGSSSSSKGDIDAGHTFLILEQTYSNGIKVIRSLGLYPASSVHPLSPNSSGVFTNDEFHNFDVSLTTTVSNTSFLQFIDILKNSQSEHYNLNNNNCSSFCTKKLSEIGITLPETSGSWFLGIGGGVNPGDLGEDIRQIQLLPNQTRNVSGGNSPLNQVSC
jgi:hypothetical protein